MSCCLTSLCEPIQNPQLECWFFFLYCFGFTHWWLFAQLVAFFIFCQLSNCPNPLLDFSSMILCFLHLSVLLSSGYHISKSIRKGSSVDYKLDGNMDANDTGGKQIALQSILVRKEKHEREHVCWHEGCTHWFTQWINKNISQIIWKVDK